MPETPLTKILHEFRAYRPRPQREFLTYVREKAEDVGVQKYAVEDSETAVLFLKTLNHVRSFRWRHWLFAREYILRRTAHPTATGGSPIVTVSSSYLQPQTFTNQHKLVVAPQPAFRCHGPHDHCLRHFPCTKGWRHHCEWQGRSYRLSPQASRAYDGTCARPEGQIGQGGREVVQGACRSQKQHSIMLEK